MKNYLRIALKTLGGLGMIGGIGGGVAGFGVGMWMFSSKKSNATNEDTGIVSSYSNHLFSTDKEIDLSSKAAGDGLRILNMGDSIAYGAYTWDILDGVNYVPRGESAAGFLADAFAKNNILAKNDYINYSTSKSGLRLFELLNWIRKNKLEYLTTETASKNGTREVVNSDVSQATAMTKDIASKDLVKQIKSNDIITVSIGGNDILALLKIMGQNFHDLDFKSVMPKILSALKSGDFGGIIGLDMDGMDDLFLDLEQNIEQLLQTIHLINPEAVVVFFEEPNPALHWPKLLRNIFNPIYGKIADIEKRVIGWTKDAEEHIENQSTSALNWATFATTKQKIPGVADKFDVYNANSLDIHPTIEGQAKIARKIASNLVKRYKLPAAINDYFTSNTANTPDENKLYGDLLTGDDVQKRIEMVRKWHAEGDTQKELVDKFTNKDTKVFDKKAYDKARKAQLDNIIGKINKVGTKNSKSSKSIDLIDENTIDKGFATGAEKTITEEKNDSATYSIVRSLTGLIDAITDRIPLRRELALKNAHFDVYQKASNFEQQNKNFRPKNITEYKGFVSDLESRASMAYEIYQNRHPYVPKTKTGNQDQYDKLGNPLKVFKNVKIAWFINHYDDVIKNGNDKDKKLFNVVLKKQIEAYKYGTAIMQDMAGLYQVNGSKTRIDLDSTNWDTDGNGIFSLSDAQLGTLLNILSGKGDMLSRSGPLDSVIDIQDVKNLLPTFIFNALSQKELNMPDSKDSKGFSINPNKNIKFNSVQQYSEDHSEFSGLGMLMSLLGDVGTKWAIYKPTIFSLLDTLGIGKTTSSSDSPVDGILSKVKGLINGDQSLFKGLNMSLSIDKAALDKLLETIASDTHGQEHLFNFLQVVLLDDKVLDKFIMPLLKPLVPETLKTLFSKDLVKGLLVVLEDMHSALHKLNTDLKDSSKKQAAKVAAKEWSDGLGIQIDLLAKNVEKDGFSIKAVKTLMVNLESSIAKLATATGFNNLNDSYSGILGILKQI